MTVFNLPTFSAARVFPRPAATSRKPVIRNSRDKMSKIGKSAQRAISSKASRLMNIPKVKTLSDRASMNLPNSETCPNFLANHPSNQSVSAAKRKITSALVRNQGREVSGGGYKNAITTNINGILERVSKLGKFIQESFKDTCLNRFCNNKASLVVDLFSFLAIVKGFIL